MAGILPEGGTDPQNTLNAQVGAKLVALCRALFYRTKCNPRFDPQATNALISEILNAVNVLNDYDCSKLDNLAKTLQGMRKFEGLSTRAPDADDLIAGTYDGVAGVATVLSILQLIPMIFPVGALQDEDYFPFYNASVGATQRVSWGSIRQAVTTPSYFGPGWTWKDVLSSRVFGQAYQNNRSVPIQLNLMMTRDQTGWVYLSDDGDNWLLAGTGAGNSGEKNNFNCIIPPGTWYRNDNTNTFIWLELNPD